MEFVYAKLLLVNSAKTFGLVSCKLPIKSFDRCYRGVGLLLSKDAKLNLRYKSNSTVVNGGLLPWKRK